MGVLMSLLAVGSLSAQEWTAEDSLRVQEMLHGDREIHVTPDLMRDLRDAFRSDPQADDYKPWMQFDETLPVPDSIRTRKGYLTLFPYTANTPYNWDPIRRRKIEVDENTWRGDPLYEMKHCAPPGPGTVTPSGYSLMAIFTKDFWAVKARKRRARTLEVLRHYRDSLNLLPKSHLSRPSDAR